MSLDGLRESDNKNFNFTTGQFPNTINSKNQNSNISHTGTSRTIINDIYKYQVLKGNNSNLVQRVLSSRYWWGEFNTYSGIPQFKWSPCSIKADFPRLS